LLAAMDEGSNCRVRKIEKYIKKIRIIFILDALRRALKNEVGPKKNCWSC
jgi:hypothetical protein